MKPPIISKDKKRLILLETGWEQATTKSERMNFIRTEMPKYTDIVFKSVIITEQMAPHQWSRYISTIIGNDNLEEAIKLVLDFHKHYNDLYDLEVVIDSMDYTHSVFVATSLSGIMCNDNEIFDFAWNYLTSLSNITHIISIMHANISRSSNKECILKKLQKWFSNTYNAQTKFMIDLSTSSTALDIISEWHIECKFLYTQTKRIAFAPKAVRSIFLQK